MEGERETGRGGVSERRKLGGREREKGRDKKLISKRIVCYPPIKFFIK